MLYEQHPSLVHSTVCVLIVPVKVGSLEACSNSAIASNQSWDGQLPWHSVEGINRLCTRVSTALHTDLKALLALVAPTLLVGMITGHPVLNHLFSATRLWLCHHLEYAVADADKAVVTNCSHNAVGTQITSVTA